MGERDDFSCGDVWDEYQWERFLQKQDRCTERYFTLLEKYLDHPDRELMISREMGWENPCEENEWEREFLCGEEEDENDACAEEEFDRFSKSRIYQDTLNLHSWINAWLASDDGLNDEPEAVRLAARSAVCGAKLAAALCGDDSAELGMTIAYLKRALKAANDSLDAASKLKAIGRLDGLESATATNLIFAIRDRIVDLMGEYRMEWLRRYGGR